MYEAYKASDLSKGERLQKKIHSLRTAMSNPPLAPFLEVLRMRGLKSGNVRPPLREMNTQEISALRSIVVGLAPELGIAR